MDNLVRDPVVIQTKLGAFRVEFSYRGLARLEFCKGSVSSARSRRQQAASLPYNLVRQLQRYADGKPVRWNLPIDLSSGTTFQQKVWRVLATIPYGETRSYGWVARKVGNPGASRAVGSACGANPVPVIIPCHRVIASDGSIGGFGGGLPMKRRLLSLERKSSGPSTN
jgi:methylated-DNA-[protein]-cysteine S-methyltransferase